MTGTDRKSRPGMQGIGEKTALLPVLFRVIGLYGQSKLSAALSASEVCR